MRLLKFFAAALLLGGFAPRAEARIVAATDTVDFGMILETDGPKSLRVFVRNEGDAPVGILKVRPTCGCTAADYGKEEAAPGDSIWIDLTYNPFRRPGSFEKGVKVYPTEGDMIRIPIKGTVMASEETMSQMFPVDAGLLRLSERTLMTLTPLTTERKSLYLDLYNPGQRPVYTSLESDSEAVATQAFPETLPPGEKGMVGVYLDPRKEPSDGKLAYTLLLRMSEDPDALAESEPFEIKVYTEKSVPAANPLPTINTPRKQ